MLHFQIQHSGYPWEYHVCVWKDFDHFVGGGLCLCVLAHVPLLAAVPEAPAPAELYVSGYPGSLPASHISEHTMNDSPSSKRRSQAPLTKTHKHGGIKKSFHLLKLHFGYMHEPFQAQ